MNRIVILIIVSVGVLGFILWHTGFFAAISVAPRQNPIEQMEQ